MNVTTELKDFSEPAQPNIRVHDHWPNRKMVELEVAGKRYTVSADELKRAIENATNFGWGM